MKEAVQASVFLVEDKLSRNYGRRLGTSKIVVGATPDLVQGPANPFADHSADSGFGH